MTEFSIFFHQNQLLKIRKFQDEVCGFLIQNGILCVPVSPLRIQCENLSGKSKVTSITIESDKLFDEIASPAARNDEKSSTRNDETGSGRDDAENKILSLKAELEIDGKKTQGKVEIVQILGNAKARHCEKRSDEAISDIFSAISQIKKITPFKICEIEITKTPKSSQWKILSEKWVKSK